MRGSRLVLLMALADLGIGMPYLAAAALGLGDGRVVAPTYEYGNTFLIAAGLLNLLVVLDAGDIARGAQVGRRRAAACRWPATS